MPCVKRLISRAISGLGLCFLLLPSLLYYWLTNLNHYNWFVSGPWPQYLLADKMFLQRLHIILLCAGVLLYIIGKVLERKTTRPASSQENLTNQVISSLWQHLVSSMLGIGLLIIVSPIVWWFWISGSYERYIWIISGPPPFDQFGGGPYLLFHSLFIELAGFSVFALGLVLNNKLLQSSRPKA